MGRNQLATFWEEGGKLGRCFTLMSNLDGTNRRGGWNGVEGRGGPILICCRRSYSSLHLTCVCHRGKKRKGAKCNQRQSNSKSVSCFVPSSSLKLTMFLASDEIKGRRPRPRPGPRDEPFASTLQSWAETETLRGRPRGRRCRRSGSPLRPCACVNDVLCMPIARQPRPTGAAEYVSSMMTS